MAQYAASSRPGREKARARASRYHSILQPMVFGSPDPIWIMNFSIPFEPIPLQVCREPSGAILLFSFHHKARDSKKDAVPFWGAAVGRASHVGDRCASNWAQGCALKGQRRDWRHRGRRFQAVARRQSDRAWGDGGEQLQVSQLRQLPRPFL